jgi:hypothetical protein
MSLMSRKTLFFLSSDSFHVHVWQNGALSKATYFPHSTEGLEQFSAFLETHHGPAFLLVDLIEEDFRQETVPHLTGANHHALVLRKFDQFYRNTPFRLARLQRRQSEGRRDDELLFSALTNPARISAWLDLMLLHKTPIVGIYSVPHISAPLIKDIDSDHLLLLSWEKNAGLRQSYFFNKRLLFSRLTPLGHDNAFADAIATESARTQQYLQSLSLAPQGKMLNVYIICHSNDRAQLDAHLPSNQNMHYAYLDLQQLGKQLKSQDIYTDSDATPLFLHLLATQPPRASYATSPHSHYFQLWQTQRGLFGLAAATALACLVWSTLSLIEGSGNRYLQNADQPHDFGVSANNKKIPHRHIRPQRQHCPRLGYENRGHSVPQTAALFNTTRSNTEGPRFYPGHFPAHPHQQASLANECGSRHHRARQWHGQLLPRASHQLQRRTG